MPCISLKKFLTIPAFLRGFFFNHEVVLNFVKCVFFALVEMIICFGNVFKAGFKSHQRTLAAHTCLLPPLAPGTAIPEGGLLEKWAYSIAGQSTFPVKI